MNQKQDANEPSEKVKKIVNAIKEKTAMPAYHISIVKDGIPSLFDSKFGGVPYWELSKEYPVDSSGNKMMLLAQINFTKEALKDDRLPYEGMLQFFIAMDDVYGLDFDEPASQKDFRVVFHEKINPSVTKEQVLELDIPIATDKKNEEYTPVFRETTVQFIKTNAYMGTEDAGFAAVFQDAVKELFGEETGENGFWDYLDDEEGNYLCDELGSTGHWVLGYPFFTQTDIRENMDEETAKYYDTLLFQMDSEMEDHEDYTLWGDCGVANFFMNQEALKNRDFSKVVYNWDCY